MQKNLNYRPDIDGLRAVAVTSVVLCHFFPRFLAGGFVGVDIFFVISGFLIGRIILSQLSENRFSFIDFYSRRIRRIFPALIIVLIFTLAVGRWLFFDFEFLLLSRHLIGGALFFINFLLRQEVGYFDVDAEFKPLLHLWSLSIEEQFYILFPLLLWFLFKRQWRIFVVIVFLAAFSFWLNFRNITRHPDLVFYMPWTRFWELLSGAILAHLTIQRKLKLFNKINRLYLNHFLSFLGAFLLIFGFFYIQSGENFPGAKALIPVFGAVFLIAAGENAFFNQIILKNRIAIFLGRISYPLYLWHWPILCYAKLYAGKTPSVLTLILLIAVAIILATLTTLFIEKPLRFGNFGRRKAAGLFVSMIIIALLGAGVTQYYHLPKNETDPTPGWFYESTLEKNWSEWFFVGNRNATRRIVLAGDSHAQQVILRLDEVLGSDYAIDFISGHGCGFGKSRVWSGQPFCQKMRDHILKSATPDVFIVGDYMLKYRRNWNKENLIEILKDKLALFDPLPQKVIILGDPGEVDFPCEKAKARRRTKMHEDHSICPAKEGIPQMHRDFIKWTKTWQKEKDFPPNVHFIYPFLHFCDEKTGLCRARDEKGRWNFLDKDHLSYAGSLWLAKEIEKIVRSP